VSAKYPLNSTSENPWKDREAILAREAKRREEEDFFESLFYAHDPSYLKDNWTPRWLVEDFLPMSYVLLLAGPYDAGKSALATAIAKAVATGTPFAGKDCLKGSVIWSAKEEGFQERLALLSRDEELSTEPMNIFTCHYRLPPIDTDLGIKALDYWITRVDAKLIVIDSLYASVSTSNLSDGYYARKAMMGLKQLAEDRNVAMIVLHQLSPGKSMRIADSVQLTASASINAVYTPAGPMKKAAASSSYPAPAEGSSQTRSIGCAATAPSTTNPSAHPSKPPPPSPNRASARERSSKPSGRTRTPP
jgi:hypothetical protein